MTLIPSERKNPRGRYSVLALAAATLVAISGGASAHEYWIEPLDFRIEAGDTASAELKVGQHFKGASRSYLPGRFFAFDVANGSETTPVEGRIGARPAIQDMALAPGLNIVTQETRPEKLTWKTLAEFEAFVAMHGLEQLVARHRDRGLKEGGFVERYRRNAKALVQVGDEPGSDRRVGMAYELVAEANPYALDGDVLPVRLYWDGAPEAGAQLHVFRKSDGEDFSRVVTDADGRANIPVEPGETYMVNAVHMVEREGRAEEDHAVWESYWSSLTFAVPE